MSIVLVFGTVEAQIGGKTYQRVKSKPPAEQKKSQGASAQEIEPSKVEEKSVISDEIGGGHLTIGENLELTFPAGLKECRVFDAKSLEKAVLKATWKGECEWIVLRPSSDWDMSAPLWLQMEKPLVLEDKHPLSIDHPLVITNDTGRAIIFKTPKNGGCTVIMRKKDVAILGFTFEGAICR